ncbi:hypothetical protein ACM66B_005112 [Microbotryomycetes sp. NB124-2]
MNETGHRTRQRTTGARQCWRPLAGTVDSSWNDDSDDNDSTVTPAADDLVIRRRAPAAAASGALIASPETETSAQPVRGAITRHRRLSMTMSISRHQDHCNRDSPGMLPTPPLTAKLYAQDIDPLDRDTTTPVATIPTNLSRPAPKFPHLDAYMASAVQDSDKRHPRELVPEDVGFPTHDVAHLVKPEDSEDKLLMAICAVLHSHDNRALCPKEIVEVMFERQWLFNAGLTPHTHISTCIRSHLRRAAHANPPYYPLLRSHDLTGAVAPHDVPAVGLKSEDRPAIKRGTLWFLDENALGQGVGADDPFVKTRLCQGLTVECGSSQAPGYSATGNAGGDVDGEEDEMGRGKRKRRISTAALAAWTSEHVYASSTQVSSAAASPFIARDRSSSATGLWSTQQPFHRHSNSMSAVNEASHSIPKLKLRLGKLEETPAVEDSDGFSSDAAFYRARNRKKVRAPYQHEGEQVSSRSCSTSDQDDDMNSDDDVSSTSDDDSVQPAHKTSAFSSATSSALLAQSLLAASAPTVQTSLAATQAADLHAAVTPGSLKLETADNSLTLPHHSMSHLSISAPSLFSAFPSYRPVTTAQADNVDPPASNAIKQQTPDSSDEDDFNDAALHGEEFDFEWGAASYATSVGEDERDLMAVSQDKMDIVQSREPSVSAVTEVTFQEGNEDVSSTPATTPRSLVEDPESRLATCADVSAMDVTLCKAFEDEGAPPDAAALAEMPVATFDRSTSTTSLVDLGHELGMTSTPKLVPISSTSLTMAVPLPSPLVFDQPPTALPGREAPTGFNFDTVTDCAHAQRELELANAADDEQDDSVAESEEDEDDVEDQDQLVTIKMEDAMFEQDVDDENDAVVRGARMTSWRNSSRAGSHSFVVVGTPSASGSDHGRRDLEGLRSTSLELLSPVGSPTDATEWSMAVAEFEGLDEGQVGPEEVDLDELDLVWANGDLGSAEEGDDEDDESMWRRRDRAHQRADQMKGSLTSAPPFAVAPPLTAVGLDNEHEHHSSPSSNAKARTKPKKRTSSSSVATLRRSRRKSTAGQAQ